MKSETINQTAVNMNLLHINYSKTQHKKRKRGTLKIYRGKGEFVNLAIKVEEDSDTVPFDSSSQIEQECS